MKLSFLKHFAISLIFNNSCNIFDLKNIENESSFAQFCEDFICQGFFTYSSQSLPSEVGQNDHIFF